MSNVILRYRKWVPRGIRRNLSPAELEAEMKLTFKGLSKDTDPDNPQVLKEGGVGKGIADPEADSDLPEVVIRFGFWSVKGALSVEPEDAEGDKAVVIKGVTRSNKISFKVAPDQDVVATAWYYADSSNAKDLLIDAFDVDLGDWVLDDFVDVEPDTPEGKLTFDANENGLVSTTTEENVVAYEQIHAVPFGWWRIVAAKGVISVNKTYKNGGPAGRALTAAAGSSGVAWAYYFTPDEDPNKKKHPVITIDEPLLHVEVSYGVAVGGGGTATFPGGKKVPVPPWEPPGPGIYKDFAAGLTLAAVAGIVKPELRAGILEMAERQLSLGAGIGRRSKALAALGSVVSASLGALTLHLFQAADPDAKGLIVVLGTAAAAAIGYFLPDRLRRW